MKLGLFGGSFDPIHTGHIRPVQEARLQLGLDQVIFLPTAVPPHKPGRQFAPPHARFAMVELALLREEGLRVSPIELTPEQPCYTIETLRHFRRHEPDAELYLLVGSDGFAELNTWREWTDIVRLSQLAVLTRPGRLLADIREHLPTEVAELTTSGRVHFVRNEAVDVSATKIRKQLAERGELPAGAVPELVLEYIQKYSLYQ